MNYLKIILNKLKEFWDRPHPASSNVSSMLVLVTFVDGRQEIVTLQYTGLMILSSREHVGNVLRDMLNNKFSDSWTKMKVVGM